MEVFLMKKTILFPLIFVLLILNGCTLFSQNEITESSIRKIGLSQKEEIPADFIPHDIKVVLLGDSLTEGVGDQYKKGGYLPYLQELLEGDKGINKAEILNFGVSGHRTDQLLRRLENKEVKMALDEVDMVLITIGGNDMLKVVKDNIANLTIEDFQREKQSFNQNLQQIVSEIRSMNGTASIVLIGLYNPFSSSLADIKEINQVINDWNQSSKLMISQYNRAYYVEIADIFKGDVDNLLHTDSFHPNNQGYELIAHRVYEVLDEDVLEGLHNELLIVNKQEIQ
jgi:lysophospholipase L1-like esterase